MTSISDSLIGGLIMTEAATITLYALYQAYRFVRPRVEDDDCPHPCPICDPEYFVDDPPALLLSPPPGGHEHETAGASGETVVGRVVGDDPLPRR